MDVAQEREVSVDLTVAETTPSVDSPGRRAWRRFRRHRLAIVGSIVLIGMALMAIFAPVVGRHDPLTVDIYNRSQPPSSEHWFGTDRTGRDVWARTIFAGRISLSVGLVAVSVSGTVGTVLGALAGYYGGRLDNLLMRMTDIIMSFPPLIVILTVVAIVGPNIRNIMIVIGLLSWPPLARLIRAQFLSTKERDFVLAARCLGVPTRQIIFRHILPHAIAPLVVFATFGMATAILLEAGLSFLGIGVQPPTPSWGEHAQSGPQPGCVGAAPLGLDSARHRHRHRRHQHQLYRRRTAGCPGSPNADSVRSFLRQRISSQSSSSHCSWGIGLVPWPKCPQGMAIMYWLSFQSTSPNGPRGGAGAANTRSPSTRKSA